MQILWSQSSSISSSSSVSGSISIVGISESLLYPSPSPKPPGFAEILLYKLELPTGAVDPPGATSVRIGFVKLWMLEQESHSERHHALRSASGVAESFSIWVDTY